MAAAMFPARAASSMFPRLTSPRGSSSTLMSVYARSLSVPLLPRISLSIPAISLNLPSLPSLEEIWDGLLKAVPKKKTSHSKKRHRQMAGKALKDETALCHCPSCGRMKRMHLLCPHCLKLYGELMTTGAHKPEKPKAKAKTTTKAIEKEEEEVKPNQE